MNYQKKSRLHALRRLVMLAACTVGAVMASPSASAAVTFIGEAVIQGNAVDKSGLNGAILEDGVSPNNGLNGFGSGLAYAGGNVFYGLADRGPNKVAYPGGTAVDNTTSYPNRYQQFNVTVTPNNSGGFSVSATNIGTTLLKNAQGTQYLGISTAFSTDPNVENHRLDSEAIRVAPDGSTWVSDEYGPYILHFNRLGQEIGSLPLPAGFQVANPGPTATYEAANNTSGRTTNRGMEGLAITPDGKTLVGMMQSSLIQDGGLNGSNVRILVYDLTNPTATPKQYDYQMGPIGAPSNATPISELLAINNHQFLVDERDGNTGTNVKKLLYEFDLNQAVPPTDLTTSAYAGTTAANGFVPVGNNTYLTSVPPGVTPLAKTLFADIGSILNAANASVPGSAFTTDGINFKTSIPDKIEGYAWGPDLADGRRLLLATNDNDFVQPGNATTGLGYPNYIFAFAVDPTDVPGYQPETFNNEALNNITNIIVVYQENWPFDGLYGSFPGANGIANATTASTTQIDRVSGAPISTLSSFGNAALSGVSTANPPPPLTADSANSLPDPNFVPTPNTLQPWSLSSFINPSIKTGDIYHRYWQEQFQIAGTVADGNTDPAGGNNSGLVTWSDNPGLVMSHFDATNLPEGLLAQQYTICDNFFHSAFGGSFLNHQFLIAAAPPVYTSMPSSNNGTIPYLDAHGVFVLNTSGSASGRFVHDGSVTPMPGDVLPNIVLNGAAPQNITLTTANCQAYFGGVGTTFDKHYVVNTSYSTNFCPTFSTYGSVALLPSLNNTNPSGPDYTQNIGDLLDGANVSWKWYAGGWNDAIASSKSNPANNGGVGPNTVDPNFQWHHAPFAYFEKSKPFDASQPGGLNAYASAHLQDETNLYTDISNNTLPAVSFVKFLGPNNEHPGYANVQQGQQHVADLVAAVQANPALWAHTAIIITYDEHGGRWDHVTPPLRDIWGPGQRVPAIVISPYAKQSYVDHTQYDTSSILSTIEQRFSLTPLNQRDGSAPTMASIFTNSGISKGSFVINRRSGKITENVTVTNLGSVAQTGPVQLALDNLSAGTTLTNASGTTATTTPTGSPYITISTGDLAPGASATVTLQFTVPASGGVAYSARTVVGTANP